jgi:hypothetical protein
MEKLSSDPEECRLMRVEALYGVVVSITLDCHPQTPLVAMTKKGKQTSRRFQTFWIPDG